MKAIVTGATGFLGSHLVETLVDKGWSVIAFGRNATRGKVIASEQVHYKYAEITDKKQLKTAFEAADVVFHCAAHTSIWGDYSTFYDTNVTGSLNVLECCEDFMIKRLVYISSSSVYFDFDDHASIKEDDALDKGFVNAYAKTKYLGEKVLLKHKKNTEVAIIRPKSIIGERDLTIMPRIQKIADSGIFPIMNNGEAVVDITYVKNVTHALLLLAEADSVDGKCYNITNDSPLKVKDFLQKIFNNRSKKVCLVKTPYKGMYLASGAIEAISKTLHLGEPRLTRFGVGLFAKTLYLNIDKAKQELGYKPIFTLEQGIERYSEWEHVHYT